MPELKGAKDKSDKDNKKVSSSLKKTPSAPSREGGTSASFRKESGDSTKRSSVTSGKASGGGSLGGRTTKPSAGAGSTLRSAGAIGGPPLTDEMMTEAQAVHDQVLKLQESVAFAGHKDTVAELDHDIDELRSVISGLRSRGYRYKGFLENKIDLLSSKWTGTRGTVVRELENSETELQPQVDDLARHASTLMAGGTQSKLNAVKADYANLKAKADAAGDAISKSYDEIRMTFYQTQGQLRQIDWMLDQVEQASFDVLAEENPVQAVEAHWWKDGKKKGPEGVLYLTDQRLLFEQKEKVATKKVLFVTTESELVQGLVFEAPFGSIEKVTPTDQGMFSNEDHLDFEFGSGAPFAVSHFHIKGQDCKEWAAVINRIKTGTIRAEWHYAAGESQEDSDQTLQDSIAGAPEKCTACGAAIGGRIAKGQRQITCEYCGTAMHW